MTKLFLSGVLSAAAVFATPVASVVTVDFVSAAKHAPTIGDIIVSPYTISINGVNTTALCIDFADNVPDSSWKANLSTDGGDVSKTYNPTSAQQYEEEAYIFTQITKSGISAQTKKDLQEAAWDIMDPNYYKDAFYFGKTNPYKPDQAALNYVTLAENNYKSVDFSRFEIVSATNSGDCDRAQEFLIDPMPAAAAPEPASCALLGGGLLLAGAARFFRRKKATA